MSTVTLEQALFRRDREQAPRLVTRSPDLPENLLPAVSDILIAFGERPPGVACPGAVFAQPLGRSHVAVVQVKDADPGPTGWAGLWFHLLLLSRNDYGVLGGDPFALAARLPATFDERPLDAVVLPAQALAPRSIDQVQCVLRRIKAHALPEGVDPDKLPPLDADNAESPMLLGGTQILVDGGKLIFERSRPDPGVVQALWTLLPHALRPRLWPATFAFGNDLGFDVLVVPRLHDLALGGYTLEDQAGDYPAGSYELALQTAAESGTEADVQAVFSRRTGSETLGLAVRLLIGVSLLVVAFRFLGPPGGKTDVVARAATVAGAVGVAGQSPWTAFNMIDAGDRIFRKKDGP